MQQIDYYIVSTRGGKIKRVFEATKTNLKKAQKMSQASGEHLLSGHKILTKEDIITNGGNFLILIAGQVKDKVSDFDEAIENARTYQTALETLNDPSIIEIVQLRRMSAERRAIHFPFEEGLDELTLKRFHMNHRKQQDCEYCHPNYPAQPYQDFNFCPHCGRYLH